MRATTLCKLACDSDRAATRARALQRQLSRPRGRVCCEQQRCDARLLGSGRLRPAATSIRHAYAALLWAAFGRRLRMLIFAALLAERSAYAARKLHRGAYGRANDR